MDIKCNKKIYTSACKFSSFSGDFQGGAVGVGKWVFGSQCIYGFSQIWEC